MSPATRISPLSASRWPASTSTSCRWPLPETPAMPTISPPRTASDTSWTATAPASSSALSLLSSSRVSPTSPIRAGAVTGQLAAAKDGHIVGERPDLAEFVGDHQNRQIAVDDHSAQHAQHL